jgi:dephospho-CoA kinase
LLQGKMIVGLTGGIASGKSTVSKTFIQHMIPVVDADIVARQVVEVGRTGWELVKGYFGKEYLNEDSTINRVKLGAHVFSDKKDMCILNAIMGPAIQIEAYKQIGFLKAMGHKIIVWDAALICEMDHADKYRPLIVVHCKQETQLDRLMKRNSLSYKEAMARIDTQMSAEEKIKLADYTVNTNGTIEESIAQTEAIIKKLQETK